jgi:DnaJ-class molecular chaperone
MKIRIELTPTEYQSIDSIEISVYDETTAREMIDIMANIMQMIGYQPQSIQEACYDYWDDRQPPVDRSVEDCGEPEIIQIYPAYKTCVACDGSGLLMDHNTGLEGIKCYFCNGTGKVLAWPQEEA